MFLYNMIMTNYIPTDTKEVIYLKGVPITITLCLPEIDNGLAALEYDHWVSMPYAEGLPMLLCETADSIVPKGYDSPMKVDIMPLQVAMAIFAVWQENARRAEVRSEKYQDRLNQMLASISSTEQPDDPLPESIATPQNKTCKHCNKKIVGNFSYCTYCGKDFEIETMPDRSELSPHYKPDVNRNTKAESKNSTPLPSPIDLEPLIRNSLEITSIEPDPSSYIDSSKSVKRHGHLITLLLLTLCLGISFIIAKLKSPGLVFGSYFCGRWIATFIIPMALLGLAHAIYRILGIRISFRNTLWFPITWLTIWLVISIASHLLFNNYRLNPI